MSRPARTGVPLSTIGREGLRIGVTGFGGPPTHIVLLRRLCVTDRGWIGEAEFEDAIAAVNLLPGPASTQLAIWCGWRLRRTAGALAAGLWFIVPGLVLIIGLAAVFLATNPPEAVLGATAGAGSAVAAVALHTAWGLAPASWKRIQSGDGAGFRHTARYRWVAFASFGATAAALIGPWLVLVLLSCGLVEAAVRAGGPRRNAQGAAPLLVPAATAVCCPWPSPRSR